MISCTGKGCCWCGIGRIFPIRSLQKRVWWWGLLTNHIQNPWYLRYHAIFTGYQLLLFCLVEKKWRTILIDWICFAWGLFLKWFIDVHGTPFYRTSCPPNVNTEIFYKDALPASKNNNLPVCRMPIECLMKPQSVLLVHRTCRKISGMIFVWSNLFDALFGELAGVRLNSFM